MSEILIQRIIEELRLLRRELEDVTAILRGISEIR